MKPTATGHKHPTFSMKGSRDKISESVSKLFQLKQWPPFAWNFPWLYIPVQVSKAVNGDGPQISNPLIYYISYLRLNQTKCPHQSSLMCATSFVWFMTISCKSVEALRKKIILESRNHLTPRFGVWFKLEKLLPERLLDSFTLSPFIYHLPP